MYFLGPGSEFRRVVRACGIVRARTSAFVGQNDQPIDGRDGELRINSVGEEIASPVGELAVWLARCEDTVCD